MRQSVLFVLGFLCSLSLPAQVDSSSYKKADDMLQRFYDLAYADPDAAIRLLDSIDVFTKRINYTLGINEVLRQRGLYYTERGDFVRSLGLLLAALKADEKIRNDDGIATDLMYIGLCFFEQEKLPEARNYLEQALHKYTLMKDEAGVAMINANLGMVYRNMSRYEEALRCYESVRDFYVAQKNDENLSKVENNLGNVLKDMGDFDGALQHFLLSKELKGKINDQYGMVISLSNIADIYVEKRQFDQAFEMYEQALTMARDQQSIKLQKDVFADLSAAFEKKGDLRNALDYYRRSVQLQDSLISSEYNAELADMKVKYESERKESENSILKKDNELQQERIDDIQKRNMFFGALAGIVFIAGVWVSLLYRKKKRLNTELGKTNEKFSSQNATLRELNRELIRSEENLLQANTTKDQLLAMISHDLYNPVTNVINYTREVKNTVNSLSREQVEEAFRKINSGVVPLQDLLDNILQWARSQSREIEPQMEKVNVSSVVKDVLELYQPGASFKRITITARGVNVPDVVTDRLMLYFILRNVVNNAVKFAPSDSEISVSCLVVQNILEIIVSDKGRGFAKEVQETLNRSEDAVSTHGSGIGLAMSRKFVKALNGEIRFENGSSGGAKVLIRIPGR